MSANRLVLTVAAPAGLVGGALAWMLFGASSPALARLQSDTERLASTHLNAPAPASLDTPISEAAGHPLFALTTGPGAVADVVVQLQGVARSSRGASALLALNGGEPSWLDLGKSRNGVTLEEVLPAKVVLLTPLGRKEVVLGAAPSSGGPGATSGSGGDAPNPDMRLPPAPASAPGAP